MSPQFTYVQFDFKGLWLAQDATLVGKYKFPLLKEQQLIPGQQPKPINYMLSDEKVSENWYHCFIADRQFEMYWNNFHHYDDALRSAAGLISTDFSVYRDSPEAVQIWNCYRNRVMAYAMQKVNSNVIPTASFGGENTWDWCFDGLPKHSTYAITTNGTLSDPEANRLFVGGVDALVKTLEPYALVVCGNYPEWLNQKYPDICIVPILSYGQIWNLRRKS